MYFFCAILLDKKKVKGTFKYPMYEIYKYRRSAVGSSARLWCHNYTVPALSAAHSTAAVDEEQGACSGMWQLTNHSKLSFSNRQL